MTQNNVLRCFPLLFDLIICAVLLPNNLSLWEPSTTCLCSTDCQTARDPSVNACAPASVGHVFSPLFEVRPGPAFQTRRVVTCFLSSGTARPPSQWLCLGQLPFAHRIRWQSRLCGCECWVRAHVKRVNHSVALEEYRPEDSQSRSSMGLAELCRYFRKHPQFRCQCVTRPYSSDSPSGSHPLQEAAPVGRRWLPFLLLLLPSPTALPPRASSPHPLSCVDLGIGRVLAAALVRGLRVFVCVSFTSALIHLRSERKSDHTELSD